MPDPVSTPSLTLPLSFQNGMGEGKVGVQAAICPRLPANGR
jgi:hypothetical protein